MSLWSNIIFRLKEMLKPMIGSRTIEQTLHVSPMISSQMEHAIEIWSEMYKNEAPWLHEPDGVDNTRVVSLGLPAMIASEKARTALIEFNSEITVPEKKDSNKDNSEDDILQEQDIEFDKINSTTAQSINNTETSLNSDRAEFLESQYKKLKKQLRKQVEYGIAKGGLVIKPYIVRNKNLKGEETIEIEFDFIQADCFYPLAFDASGRITECAFIDTEINKDLIYRRLEYHKWENNTLIVKNKAYKSTNTSQSNNSGVDLGQEIPLTEVSNWAGLEASAKIDNVDRPLYGYFKMPEANTVDPTSPLGVSGFSRAQSLIKDADMQYSRLLWEYEAGEMAIDIDRDALQFLEERKDRDGRAYNGRSVLGKMQQRLYRKVDLGESSTFEPWSPALRDTSFINGLNTILMRIEDVVSISRGTLSDVSAEARTATELKILKQRSYQSNADIQQALEDTLRDVIYAMNAYCSLYKITPEGKYDVSFEWDDSIIVDIDTELTKRLTLQQNGLASKLENRMWYFGETERQAEEALQKINDENAEEMEQEMSQQNNLNNFKGNSVKKQ